MQPKVAIPQVVGNATARLVGTIAARTLFFVLVDVLLWTLSLHLAFLFRFDGRIPATYWPSIVALLALAIPLRLACYAAFRLYQISWRLIGVREVVQALKASAIAALGLASGILLLRDIPGLAGFPRSVLIVDFVLSTGLVVAFRLSRRMMDEAFRGNNRDEGIRVLIVGAGAAGGRAAAAMLEGGDGPRHHPVAMIDDDVAKHGTYVHGLKVLGGRRAIAGAVKRLRVDEIVIAIPSASPATVRELVRYSRDAGVKRLKVLPSINELLSSQPPQQAIRDVRLEDLLGRDLVQFDQGRTGRFLAGKTVMVTGAGGSIGSELARQLAVMESAQLVLLDNSEPALFELQNELGKQSYATAIQYVIGDIRDEGKIRQVFRQWRPDVVYHAAAYKHVPLMEMHADEAVRTNLFGTLVVAEAALEIGSQAFVLISSDKAVNPASVMGATKRVAELIVRALNGRGRTHFMAVRFGNVIGSRGSVIPVMQEQIRHGGPVTVTHPEMTRYFMSAREAVALVLRASAMESPRGTFVLDMGEPVRILELAQELIRLSGLEPDKDIPIVFTGIRAGEKLHEALETSDEPLLATDVPKLFEVASNGQPDEITLRLALQELERLSRGSDMAGIREVLRRLTVEPNKMPLWPAGRLSSP